LIVASWLEYKYWLVS